MATSIGERTLFQPETIECLAILRGLQQCIPLSILNLIVESDCHSIVQQIQGLVESFLPLGNIIKDIQKLVSMFRSYTVQF